MKKVFSIIIFLSIFIQVYSQTQKDVSDNVPDKVIVAYVTSWSDVIPDPAYMTHINYAFGHVNDSFNGVKINNEERLKQICALKQQNPSLKVLLSIGGWGSGRFSEMAADETNRKAFAADCRRVVDEFGLDGIDIDWEYPTSSAANISSSPDDTKNFTLLMKNIRDAIGKDKLLTLASVADAKYIDFREIDPFVDFVNIMSYDMASVPLHHSPLFRSANAGHITSAEAVIAHLNAGVPKEKLVMGMPFYGRGGKSVSNFIDYNKIEVLEEYEKRWDDTAKAPYLVDTEGAFVCGYDDPQSLAIKCRYILDQGLLGGMYWDYSGDNKAGDLQKTVFESLKKNKVRLTPDSELEKDIVRTGLIHSPLTLDNRNSFEVNELKKKVLYTTPITIENNLDGWKHSGLGKMRYSPDKTISGNGSIQLSYPVSTGKRAKGSPSDPDYATYGNGSVGFSTGGVDWEKYNRIVFYIYPDCDGEQVVNMDFSIENNSSEEKAPHNHQYNRQSGSHLVNMVNKQWNCCFLDLGEYQRDHIVRIGFSSTNRGKKQATGDSAVYFIDKIELQQIEDPEIVSGWQPGNNRVVYSTTGYMTGGLKTAIVNMDKKKHNNHFQLVSAVNNQVVFNGLIRQEQTSTGNFNVLDFSSFNEVGNYKLKVGDVETPPFQIGSNIWENSQWRVLNYIFCQRCGYPVPGIHETCHVDLCSKHDGKTISYSGGWHDAGDLSQQTLQTGDVTYALLEAYNKLKNKNEILAARLLEEAEWGLEFILKNRYGDGYRASSVGLLIWLDNIFGTQDDISSVRVQNLAFDNFLYSTYEAYAAMSIDRDPRMQEYLRRIAKADFDFAMKRHKEVGYGEFIHLYEHSYNTSESQYMATISWAASMLYKLTKDSYYAQIAAEYIRFTLDCQRKEPLKDKDRTNGFFYRDKSRKSIVHYIHQSREQVYMQAVTLLCETQPQHPDYSKWTESIQIYGGYLKVLMKYTAPYGMIPSGVYHVDEYQDSTSFYRLHLFPPSNAKELYEEQVKKGIPLDKEHYMKRFPVWFSIFNGNTAIHLSTGKAAAICGNFLKDKELLDIGREQMYWTVGKNPFGQSLIYGEGYNYPQMDSFSSGEIVGEMPVGIRSLGNEDIPYWPQTNNACYKEVWVTSAGKWLSLLSEY